MTIVWTCNLLTIDIALAIKFVTDNNKTLKRDKAKVIRTTGDSWPKFIKSTIQEQDKIDKQFIEILVIMIMLQEVESILQTWLQHHLQFVQTSLATKIIMEQ